MKQKSILLFVSSLILIIIIVTGTFLFSYFEGWRTIDSLYFVVASITTVGYGDFTPTHDITKIVSIIFNLVSIPLALAIFAIFAENYIERRIARAEGRFKQILGSREDH